MSHELPPTVHEYAVPEEWKESSRPVVAILAHPDDEGTSDILRKLPASGAPTIVMFLTQGEYGVPAHMAHHTTRDIKRIRKQEAEAAVASWGGVPLFLDLGDLHMSIDRTYREVFHAVFPVVRALNPVGLISFYSADKPWGIHHPDHVRAGQLTEDIGSAIDVSRYYPKRAKPTLDRATLLLLTSNLNQANLAHPLTDEDREERIRYFLTYYRSQFIEEEAYGPNGWVEIFNRNTWQPGLEGHFELARQVRQLG